MMKEFIADDHEHSFSVTSLSVQLFTNPTLAHYLISEQDVLANLFRTFMSECERKKNDREKLELHRDETMQSFKRAMYILYDVKYLLTTNPMDELCKTGWTDRLRKGFLHGVSNLLGMDGIDIDDKINFVCFLEKNVTFLNVFLAVSENIFKNFY